MSGKKIRGVNFGGWLVLERWITPSLFEGTEAQDEFSFMQEPDAAEKIKWHRRTFITESDFRWLKSHSVNAVRIPVGYWLLDGDEPFIASVSYLDWAMEMAEKYELKVLIDLHGAKGSQNGNDHSGKKGAAVWYTRAGNRQETLKILKRIAKRYEKSPALWGIELLNEPKLGPRNFFVLRQFYKQAYAELASVMRAGTHIVLSDGFRPRLFSGTVRQRWDIIPVIDVHWYQFGRVRLVNYFNKKVAGRPREIAKLQRTQPVIIGEWSGMLSHRTLAGCTSAERAHLEKRHIEEQLAAYESALGWFYWTYKTEEAGIWNFRTQVESGALAIRS